MAQSAAVLGVGLLYQGTGHRLMTEFLLGALDTHVHRQLYMLVIICVYMLHVCVCIRIEAAVLGVGLLYQGTGHRLMTEFLLGALERHTRTHKLTDLYACPHAHTPRLYGHTYM